jgi:putative phosphoribosyl transferase
MSPVFANRRDAGRQLAQALQCLHLANPLVLALPRGGVPVGYEIAKALGAPLDVLFVRKIGAPGHHEYGIGAIVDGSSPQIVIDRLAAEQVGASTEYIQRQVTRELAEIERRRILYRTGPPAELRGRTVIVADDGIATGGTVRAALQALERSAAARVILAVPVAPADILAGLLQLGPQIVCLATPHPFYAVGAHYADFAQTSDEEVVQLLDAAKIPTAQD